MLNPMFTGMQLFWTVRRAPVELSMNLSGVGPPYFRGMIRQQPVRATNIDFGLPICQDRGNAMLQLASQETNGFAA